MDNTNKTKLVSVVIPTKDRYKYLFELINTIEKFDLNEIEIVIQDNSYDNSEILEFLKFKERLFVKYFYNKDHIPISSNVDLAIHNSSGEYVCLIGDDDGILPNIVDCVKWMKANNIEALRPAIIIYNWPDFQNLGNPELSGALIHGQFSNKVQQINPLLSLQELANRGFRHIYTIPKVYQAIVKRSCLDEIYKIGGAFCPGPSPDMAAAVALSFVVEKFVAINLPVIIVGQSKHVGGGERELRGGVKNIDEVPFLPSKAKENWDKRIPKVWCSQTVWPESAIKAIQYMGKESQIHVNFEFILAWFIKTHPREQMIAYQLSHNKLKLLSYLAYYKIVSPILNFLKKIILITINNKSLNREESLVTGITNIEDACKYFEKKFSKYLQVKNLKEPS
jgi:glycosyltransferase involved in cell wall biosynthesis